MAVEIGEPYPVGEPIFGLDASNGGFSELQKISG
jgi:hypothetical protein